MKKCLETKKQSGKKEIKVIKTIIFDIGGVLIGYNWKEHLLREFNNDNALVNRLCENILGYGNWDEVDRGILTEDELFERFEKHAPDLKKEIRHFWDTLGGALWQYDFTKDWIKDLKNRGYRVLYLSNWSDHVKKCCEEQMDFLPMMDGGVFSYEEHLIKPDHAIYKAIIDKYDLDPAECVFLDDRLDNCEAARECGMKAVQVTDHDAAVEGLERLL